MKKIHFFVGIILAAALFVAVPSCTKDGGTPDGGSTEKPEGPSTPETPGEDSWHFDEDKAETIVFTRAEAQYIGDDIGSGESDHWIVTLYNSEGGELALELNGAFSSEQKAELSLLYADYTAPRSSSDFSAGTFAIGSADYVNSPDGNVTVPTGTYLKFNKDGSEQVDYLFVGSLKVSSEGISGLLSGDMFRKRHFTFEGGIEIVPVKLYRFPNTTIDSNLEFSASTFTKAEITDVTAEKYSFKADKMRAFQLRVYNGDISMTKVRYDWEFSGSGDFLQMVLFASPDSTEIPEGTYAAASMSPEGFVDSECFAPFYFRPGTPDMFTSLDGCWYVGVKDGKWSRYARLEGGSVSVSVVDGKRVLRYDFADCADPAHHISGLIEL